MPERDFIQQPVDVAYRRGIESMGKTGPRASMGEWFEAIARAFAAGLAMRGGVGAPRNPMIRFPLRGTQTAGKKGTYPAKQDLEFIASETPDRAYAPIGEMAPKLIDPKTFTLGRHTSSDTFKPGRGVTQYQGAPGKEGFLEARDPEAVKRLMDVLTSLTEIGPNVRRYPW